MINKNTLQVLVALIVGTVPVVGAQPQAPSPGPAVEFSPNPVDFGYLAPGYNENVTLTVTNTGDSNLIITKDELDRENPFSMGDDECAGRVIRPGASCEVEFSFDPENYWTHDQAAYFTIFDNASGGHQSVLLYGWDEPK